MSNSPINPAVIAVGSVVVSFGLGVGAGYLIFKKQFETIADEEIAAFKAEYSERQEAHIAAMETANQNRLDKGSVLDMAVDELSYRSSVDPVEAVKTKTVFENAKRVPDWDDEAEEAYRLENSIFIITREEFMTNSTDYEQEQLTYYEGDDVLSTNTDEIVTDVVPTVGDDCLSKFGYGSDDDDTVYVRNENTLTDYEILRTDGKYTEVILGLSDAEDIQHSSGPRRFRSYHDQ